MTLDELRQKVIFQNSIDVWIAFCNEKNHDWNNTDNYKKFIKYLHEQNLNLKKYSLCVSDAESMDEHARQKAKFAESLSESNDPNGATYTVKLNDPTVQTIQNFQL